MDDVSAFDQITIGRIGACERYTMAVDIEDDCWRALQ